VRRVHESFYNTGILKPAFFMAVTPAPHDIINMLYFNTLTTRLWQRNFYQ